VRVLVYFVVALLLSLLVCPVAIGRLAKARMGQQIRKEGPASHLGKAGTPTAGGIVIILLALLFYLVVDRRPAGGLIVLALVLGGGLGFIDDYRAFRGGRNLGLRAREKAAVQLVIGAGLAYLAFRLGFDRQLVPFDGPHSLGVWLVPLGALAFVGGSNAFNLTDGSDGLAAGAGAILFGTLAMVGLMQHQTGTALVPAVLAGVLVGFLFYNFFPARIFMGDTGSLALGSAMVASAIVSGFLWYLPLLALIFVLETASVIAQVASFKLTGKRIFKMSPLHHHFHLLGWTEVWIALSFWVVGLAAAAVTVLLARPGSVGS
jgi:phospho-N-acetylmuramoyl-pentapeptide-transferase